MADVKDAKSTSAAPDTLELLMAPELQQQQQSSDKTKDVSKSAQSDLEYCMSAKEIADYLCKKDCNVEEVCFLAPGIDNNFLMAVMPQSRDEPPMNEGKLTEVMKGDNAKFKTCARMLAYAVKTHKSFTDNKDNKTKFDEYVQRANYFCHSVLPYFEKIPAPIANMPLFGGQDVDQRFLRDCFQQKEPLALILMLGGSGVKEFEPFAVEEKKFNDRTKAGNILFAKHNESKCTAEQGLARAKAMVAWLCPDGKTLDVKRYQEVTNATSFYPKDASEAERMAGMIQEGTPQRFAEEMGQQFAASNPEGPNAGDLKETLTMEAYILDQMKQAKK